MALVRFCKRAGLRSALQPHIVGAGPRCLPCTFTARVSVGEQGRQRGPAPTVIPDFTSQLGAPSLGLKHTGGRGGRPLALRFALSTLDRPQLAETPGFADTTGAPPPDARPLPAPRAARISLALFWLLPILGLVWATLAGYGALTVQTYSRANGF